MRLRTSLCATAALLGTPLLGASLEQEPNSTPRPVVIEVGSGSPKVEIQIIEVVKTVTVGGTCAHTTGLLGGPTAQKAEVAPTPTATIVTTYIDEPPIMHETPAATSLLPAVHWDVDLHRVENLQANKTVEMFYCSEKLDHTDGRYQQPSNNTAVGFLNIDKMKFPAVQLDHTLFIGSVTCSNSSIKIAFNNRKAFEWAQADWTSHTSEIVLITVDPKCRLATDLVERGYVLVKRFSVDNSTMTLIGSSRTVGFAEAVGEETPIDFNFGNFHTNGTNGFSAPVTGPPATGNGTGSGTNGGPPYSQGASINGTLRDPSGDTSFDQTLDRRLGVMSIGELENMISHGYNMSLEDIGGDDSIPDLLTVPGLRRRHLVRRGLFSKIKSGLKSIGNVVKKGAEAIGDGIGKVAGKVGDVIEKGVDTLGKWLSISKSFNKDLSFDTKSGQSTKDTPWGPGVELFSKSSPGGKGSAAVYCVDCGATGKVALEGKVTFSVIKGLTTGYISANGALHAGLQIGIVASYKDQWGFEKDIVTIPLSPYSIPGIITLGPSISLSAGASLSVLAEGQLLAGFLADMPNLVARLDLVDKEKSVMPDFSPQVKPVFDAKGKVVLSADAFLALKIAIGINLLNGAFDKSVGIVEKPKLTVTAGVEASYSLEGGGKFSDPTCPGVKIDVGFGNELYLDFFGSKKPISDTKGEIWGHCFALQKDAVSTSALPAAPAVSSEASLPSASPASAVAGIQSDPAVPIVSSALTEPTIPAVANPTSSPLDIATTTPLKGGWNGTSTTYHSSLLATSVPQRPANVTATLKPSSTSSITAKPSNGTTPIDADDGSVFARLSTSQGSLDLHYSPNGNIYAVPERKVEDPNDPSALFTSDPSGDFIVGDSHGRYLHGYSGEMATYGVSRLRLHEAHEMPNTASLLSFASTGATGLTDSLVVLADLAGKLYFPMICVFEDAIFPKLFLAKEPVSGASKLEDPSLVSVLTGSKVKNCGYIPLMNKIVGH